MTSTPGGHRKGHARSDQELWISGVNPVREALRSGAAAVREMVLARSDPRAEELKEQAARQGIPIRQETRDALSALLGHAHHQGMALRAAEYHHTPLAEILDRPMAEREPLVVLDCIQDPQNLGAILRSACFLGVRGVILPKDRSARVTATVIKVAAGATAYLPVVQVTNLARALEELKEAGFWIAGLDVQANQSLYAADLSLPVALVVGNEQKGLRPLVRKACDLLVHIPARGPLQSLNAAAATAVALSELSRQRTMKTP